MTSLNYSVAGVPVKEIAQYLSMSEDAVNTAILQGAETFDDVYQFKKKIDAYREKITVNENGPEKIRSKTPFGKRYF